MPGFENLQDAARRLSASLEQRFGLGDNNLDRGLPRQVWPRELTLDGLSSGPPVPSPGRPDGRVGDAEVFQESFRRLEEIRFGTSSLAPEVTGGFFADYARAARYFPPWLVDDGDAATAGDRILRTAIDRIVGNARSDVNALLRSLRRPCSEGGLGLCYVFNPGNNHRRRDAVEAFVDGFGDCNAFSFIFYALAQRAGLRPQFIRITGERSTPAGPFEVIHHVGVAVRLDPSSDALTPCDPSRGVRLDEDLHLWYQLSPIEMLANHLRNVALYNESNHTTQERLLLQAYRLAPDAFDIAYDVAWYYEHVLRNFHRAAPYLRRAQEINPSLTPIWETETGEYQASPLHRSP